MAELSGFRPIGLRHPAELIRSVHGPASALSNREDNPATPPRLCYSPATARSPSSAVRNTVSSAFIP
jgi:hypothetical protein